MGQRRLIGVKGLCALAVVSLCACGGDGDGSAADGDTTTTRERQATTSTTTSAEDAASIVARRRTQALELIEKEQDCSRYYDSIDCVAVSSLYDRFAELHGELKAIAEGLADAQPVAERVEDLTEETVAEVLAYDAAVQRIEDCFSEQRALGDAGSGAACFGHATDVTEAMLPVRQALQAWDPYL
jgi:hypothetical protein